MLRIVILPKMSSESRIDKLDFSPLLTVGVTISSAAASSTVWSGVDSTPLVVTAASASPYANVTTSGGTAGVIYKVIVMATLSDASQVAETYYLAITPEVP